MNKKRKKSATLYFLAGILFFIAAIISKTIVYIPIGCCCVIQGCNKNNK